MKYLEVTMLKRLSFRTRLLLGFISLLLLMLGSILISLNYVEKMAESTNLIDRHPKTVLTAVRDIEIGTFEIHNFMDDIVEVKNKDQINEIKIKINKLDVKIYTTFTLLKDRYLGNMEDIKSALKTYGDWKMIREEAVSYIDKADYFQGENIVNTLGHDYIKLLTQKYHIIQDYALKKADEHFNKIEPDKKNNRNFLIRISLFLFSFAINDNYINIK